MVNWLAVLSHQSKKYLIFEENVFFNIPPWIELSPFFPKKIDLI